MKRALSLLPGKGRRRVATALGPVLAAACLTGCLSFCLSGCSSGPEDPYAMPEPLPATSPEKVVWAASPGAITVVLDAESDSNLIDGEGHVTSLCLMQVPDPAKVRAQAATEEGLRSLLACTPAPPDILSATQLFVQPGEYRVFPLDRVAGAKHVAVVAGFNTLTPEGCFADVAMPLRQEKVRDWIIMSHMEYSAAPMKLAIQVGQASISLQGTRRDN